MLQVCFVLLTVGHKLSKLFQKILLNTKFTQPVRFIFIKLKAGADLGRAENLRGLKQIFKIHFLNLKAPG